MAKQAQGAAANLHGLLEFEGLGGFRSTPKTPDGSARTKHGSQLLEGKLQSLERQRFEGLARPAVVAGSQNRHVLEPQLGSRPPPGRRRERSRGSEQGDGQVGTQDRKDDARRPVARADVRQPPWIQLGRDARRVPDEPVDTGRRGVEGREVEAPAPPLQRLQIAVQQGQRRAGQSETLEGSLVTVGFVRRGSGCSNADSMKTRRREPWPSLLLLRPARSATTICTMRRS